MCFDHLADDRFIVISFFVARDTALKQAIISLGIKQAVFVKSCFLKTVVHIGGQDKMIFIFYQIIKRAVNRLRRVHIAVDVNIPAPICPMFFWRIIWIEAAGIHILKVILGRKIPEVSFKPFSGVEQSGRSGQTGAGANDHGVCFVDCFTQLMDTIWRIF